VIEKADLALGTLSETILHNVRILALNQDGSANKERTVSLELAPEQVKKITVADQLGKLSLAVRSAVDQDDTADIATLSGCDVSPEIARIARQSATVLVYAGGKVKEYSVKKHNSGDTDIKVGCHGSPEVARQSATVVGYAGNNVVKE
jgi:pilus assembly protein CpaB